MILPIGEFVLRTACQQARAWQITIPGAERLAMSVNLSVKEFARPRLLNEIEETLMETGLEPKHLKIEITESAILENVEHVTRTLKGLRALGARLAIDDFGTGYSSLSYLHRFPVNTLKIDQAFVRQMNVAAESLQIVKTIIMLARALEMEVIAEGIEEKDQLDMLTQLGCEYGQGYYFAKPMDAEKAAELLRGPKHWLEA